MNEIQKTNEQTARFILNELEKPIPFNLKLNSGQVGSLYNLAIGTDMASILEPRVKNGTGVILIVNSETKEKLLEILK